MKRIGHVLITAMVFSAIAVPLAKGQNSTQPAGSTAVQSTSQVTSQSESLGDYARSLRKDKKPVAPKTFDNDNLPTDDKLSVVGNAEPAPTDSQAAQTGDQNQAGDKQADDSSKKADSQSPEERQKANDDWKGKIAAQKDKIDLLSRELDVLQREYKLRAAAMYADVGNRLRNAAQWDKEDAQYKQQIADKQKAVDDAKQQLDDMQEQARKAGVPSSMRE
jgi:hypothetical protein